MVSYLNPMESQDVERVRKGRLPNTKQMVEEALTKLYSAKGVTLKEVYKFVEDGYNLKPLSKIRTSRIKEHIKKLHEDRLVINKTGRGLVGRFKWVAKKNAPVKHKVIKKPINSKLTSPVIPEQTLPLQHTLSIFDTPVVEYPTYSSTPYVKIPEVRKIKNKNKLPADYLETPRSSLPKEKRKLIRSNKNAK